MEELRAVEHRVRAADFFPARAPAARFDEGRAGGPFGPLQPPREFEIGEHILF